MSDFFKHVCGVEGRDNYDTRVLEVWSSDKATMIEILDYTTMNEFGSQRNEGSKKVILSKVEAKALRDMLINKYPIEDEIEDIYIDDGFSDGPTPLKNIW